MNGRRRLLAPLRTVAALAASRHRVTASRPDWRRPLDEALLRRLERVTLAPRRTATGGLGGEHRSRAHAASTDFVDFRPYQPGDDFRQVDWNAYSRLGQLFVKLTEARERLPLHLLLDCSASMDTGLPNKHDYARQLAAVIGYVALARYDRLELVRLTGGGGAIRPLRGKQRFGDLVAALDGFHAAGKLELDAELAAFRPAGAAGQAVLISDMLHPAGYAAGLDALARAGLQPSVIQLLSPQELRPEPGGDLELEDVESGEKVEVGLSPAAIEIYGRRLADWCADLERHCAARGFRYLRVMTDEPLEGVALVALREAGILG
jgi:uncharacterized protein (DUF58 family)